MEKSVLVKLRNRIHVKFSIYFSCKKRRLDGLDYYYLISHVSCLPVGFRDFVHSFNNDCHLFHFSDGITIIE